MHRNQILENINYVMEVKRVGKNYREFNSLARKIYQYGLATLGLGVIGPALVAYYRYTTDKCRKSCGSDQRCYNQCYLMVSKKVISIIQQDIKNTKKIEDEKKRNRRTKSLNKELRVWVNRMNTYKKRLSRSEEK